MSSGGKREGAGRKRIGTEKRRSLTVMIEPSNYDYLAKMAKERGVSKGLMIDYLIRAIKI